jgi:FkbM family methyltransferase
MKNIERKDCLLNNGHIDYGFELKDTLVFDVGLNLGNKSAHFLSLGASVVGFEPQKDCYNYAMQRFAANRANGSFKAVNAALSDTIGLADFYISNLHVLSSMSKDFITESEKERFPGVTWHNKIQVETLTLDAAITQFGKPKYIKIDVEGFEYNVLRGLSSPVEYISIEFTPELYKNSEKCIDYLHALNNQNCEYNYVYRENDHFFFKEWQDIDSIKKYLSNIEDFSYEFGDIYIKSYINNPAE